MESFLDDFIKPQGWKACDDKSMLETVFYAEFNNRGPGSPKAQRVKWPGIKEVPSNRIRRFTAAEFVDGNRWIPRKTTYYAAGLVFPVPKEDPKVKYSPVSTEETKDLDSSLERQNNETETKSAPSTPDSTERAAPSPAPIDMDAFSSISRPPRLSPRATPGLAALSPRKGAAALPPKTKNRPISTAPSKAPTISRSRTFAPTLAMTPDEAL